MMPQYECVMKFLTPSKISSMEIRFSADAIVGSFRQSSAIPLSCDNFPSSVSLCVVVQLTIHWCVYENSLNAYKFCFVCAVDGADGWWKEEEVRRRWETLIQGKKKKKGDVSSQRQHALQFRDEVSFKLCDVSRLTRSLHLFIQCLLMPAWMEGRCVGAVKWGSLQSRINYCLNWTLKWFYFVKLKQEKYLTTCLENLNFILRTINFIKQVKLFWWTFPFSNLKQFHSIILKSPFITSWLLKATSDLKIFSDEF